MTHSVSVAPLRHSVMTNSALPGMTTTREQLMHEYMPMPPPYAHPHMTCRLTCNSPMKQSTATHVDFLHVNNRRSNNHPTNRCNIVLRMPLLRGVADFLRVFLRVLFGRQPESIALLTQSLEAALEVEPICYLHLTLRISFTDSVPPACKGRVWGTGVQFGMCPNKRLTGASSGEHDSPSVVPIIAHAYAMSATSTGLHCKKIFSFCKRFMTAGNSVAVGWRSFAKPHNRLAQF